MYSLQDYSLAITQQTVHFLIYIHRGINNDIKIFQSHVCLVFIVLDICGIRLCKSSSEALSSTSFHFILHCILFFLISTCLSIVLHPFLHGAACQADVLTVQTALGWMEGDDECTGSVGEVEWGSGRLRDVKERWRDGKWEIDVMHERLMRLWECAGTTDSDWMSAGLLKGGWHTYTDLCAGKYSGEFVALKLVIGSFWSRLFHVYLMVTDKLIFCLSLCTLILHLSRP